MFFDQTVMFFDNVTAAPEEAKAVEVGGSDYSKTFIASTITKGVTGLTLTVSTADDAANGPWVEVGKKVATAEEIAAGLMALPMPLDLKKFVKVVPVIAGAAEKGISCGITDAVSNGVLSTFGISAEDLERI